MCVCVCGKTKEDTASLHLHSLSVSQCQLFTQCVFFLKEFDVKARKEV